MLPGGLGIGAANLLGHLRIAAQLLQRVLELGDLLLVLRFQLCPTLNFLRLHLGQHIIVLIGGRQHLPIVGALDLKGVRLFSISAHKASISLAPWVTWSK